MDFYAAVASRRTVRTFLPDPVPEATVRRVLEAGLRAPSNAHLKHWQFVLLKDHARRERVVVEALKARNMQRGEELERFLERFEDEPLKEVYRRALPVQLTMMLQAPELLVVCYRMKALAECRSLFELNPLASVWMCIENIMLALAAEGLHGCTYTPYDATGLKRALEVPEGWEVAAVIPFGHAAQHPGPSEEDDLGERLHIDSWSSSAVPA